MPQQCHSMGRDRGQRPRSLRWFSAQCVHFGSIKREIYKFIAQQRKGDLHAGKFLLVMPATDAALKRVKAFACNAWRRKAELSHDASCAQEQDWQRFDLVAAANDNMKALFGKFTETGGSQTMCLESCLCSPSRLKHPNKAKKCYCPRSLCR